MYVRMYAFRFGAHAPHSPLTDWGAGVEAEIERLKDEQILADMVATELAQQSFVYFIYLFIYLFILYLFIYSFIYRKTVQRQ